MLEKPTWNRPENVAVLGVTFYQDHHLFFFLIYCKGFIKHIFYL